ncbi:MAG: SDR family NAD(P)-dependent oxidoreductase, partial [Planctomycetota bacterium]
MGCFDLFSSRARGNGLLSAPAAGRDAGFGSRVSCSEEDLMDLGLEGKSAIVTGGSIGIGTAIALALAREGCDVAINYRRHDTEANAVVDEIKKMG